MKSTKVIAYTLLVISFCMLTTGCFLADTSKEKRNSEDFIELIDNYFSSSTMQQQYSNVFYVVEGQNHKYQEPPRNEVCILNDDRWTGQGLISSNCDKVMNDIIENYSRIYFAGTDNKDFQFPTKAKLVITNDGTIGDDSEIKFGKVVCRYRDKKVSCTRKMF